MDDIHLLKLNFNDPDYLHIQNIRKVVYNDELGISESKIFDEYDKTCDHFLIFYGINIIGSLRISVFGQKIKLERMAILKKYRVNHYGKKTIIQIKEYYKALDFSEIFLDSILSVKGFYKKCGFIEEGEIFQRVGIDHVRMSITL